MRMVSLLKKTRPLKHTGLRMSAHLKLIALHSTEWPKRVPAWAETLHNKSMSLRFPNPLSFWLRKMKPRLEITKTITATGSTSSRRWTGNCGCTVYAGRASVTMGLTYLKFGHEVDAAWSIMPAYMQVQKCKEKFPQFARYEKHRDAGSDAWLHSWKVPVDNQHVWDGRFGGERARKNWNQLSTRTWTLVLKQLWFTSSKAFILQADIFSRYRSQQVDWRTSDQRLLLFLGGCVAIRTRKWKTRLNFKTFAEWKSKGLDHRLRGLPDRSVLTQR